MRQPAGKPAVFLHGGPGAGSDAQARRFFDPARYRIVLFDQRGCGQSTPHASLEHNTTWDLVADIERLRDARSASSAGRCSAAPGAPRWRSPTRETHPERVTELVLRGIFLLRKAEIDWFYQQGAEPVSRPVGGLPRADPGGGARRPDARLPPAADRRDHARGAGGRGAWSVWEGARATCSPTTRTCARWGEDEFALAFARIECHYFVNGGFIQRESQLLDDVGRIRHIPAVIVQGRYDVVCPMDTAWDLHRAWPEADLRVVADAGHSAFEPGITDALVRATRRAFAD